jgi:hypothetical protein
MSHYFAANLTAVFEQKIVRKRKSSPEKDRGIGVRTFTVKKSISGDFSRLLPGQARLKVKSPACCCPLRAVIAKTGRRNSTRLA